MISVITNQKNKKKKELSDLYKQVRIVLSPSNTERYLISEILEVIYSIAKDTIMIKMLQTDHLKGLDYSIINRLALYHLKDIQASISALNLVECDTEYRIKASYLLDDIKDLLQSI